MGRIASSLAESDNQFRPARLPKSKDVPFGRRVGLKRKVSLRDGFIRKLKKEGTRVSWNRNGKIKRKKALKKISRSLRERLKVYQFLAKIFLEKPENEWCEICERRRGAGENICRNLSTEIHHRSGRSNKMLCYVPEWIPSCYSCRTFPHEHPSDARALGLLCSASAWNIYPK